MSISVQHLTKRFGKVAAADDVSLEIPVKTPRNSREGLVTAIAVPTHPRDVAAQFGLA